MKRSSLVLSVLLSASIASAQPRAGAFTTIVSTDLTVASVCVGANAIAAPSTCTGGLQAGPTVVNLGLTLPSFTPAVVTNRLYNVGGTLTWNGTPVAVGGAVGPGTAGTIPIFTGVNSIGNSLITQAGTVVSMAATLASTVFGTSSFIAGGAGVQTLQVQNLTAGVANQAAVIVSGNAFNTSLRTYTSTFTTGGIAVANGSTLESDGTGGLSIAATNAAGVIRFYTGGVAVRGSITAAGLWNWTTFGDHQFAAGGVGVNRLIVSNPTAGAANAGAVRAASDTVNTAMNAFSSTFTTAGSNVQGGSTFAGNGVGGVSLAATHASGAVRIYTGSDTLRATFDAAGNFNLGSTNVMDSPAVPTIASFGGGATGSVAGRNTGFRIDVLTGTATNVVVNFNTTYTAAPACVASSTSSTITLGIANTTTQITVTPSAALPTFAVVYVLCRGV